MLITDDKITDDERDFTNVNGYVPYLFCIRAHCIVLLLYDPLVDTCNVALSMFALKGVKPREIFKI